MITLQKVGDALKFTFTDNPLYLQNGTIEVPVNSLTLVTDNSGIATFKKSASNDIFVCASYDELGMSKAELETWFKENAVGGGSIDSGAVQTMIDASISGKQDTLIEGIGINIDDNVISVENPTVYLTQAEYDALVSSGTVDPDTYYVISDATAIDINQYYTSAQTESAITAAVSGKQDTLSAGTGIQIDSANTISCTVTPSTYSAGRGISISNNTISTNLNVYSGQGVASVSLCNSSGNGGGESSIDGMASVGGGFQVTTKNYAETAFGTNNQSNGFSSSMSLSSGATLFSVGNGTGNTKHNAFEIRQNGDIYITSGNSDIKLQDAIGGGKAIEAGRGISITTGETADTISFNLPISAGTSVESLKIAGGSGTVASGQRSIAIGNNSNAKGIQSIAINQSTANGQDSFSQGTSYAQGFYSSAFGTQNYSNNKSELSCGQYNNSVSASTTFGDSGNTLFSVGNGTASNARHNALEIRQNGDIYISSGGTDIKLQDNLGSSIEVSSAITSGDTNPVEGGALYDELRVIKDVETKVELEFSGSSPKTSTNFPSGCTKIEVSNFAQYNTVYLCFESMGGVYGVVAWVDINNGEVSANDEIGCNPIYTISGDNLILTWTNVSQTRKWVTHIQCYSNGTIQPEINAILSERQIVPLIDQVSANTEVIDEIKEDIEEIEEVAARALIDLNDKFGGLKLQQISQADYDALVSGGTVDNSTLYIITNVVN